ncbi:MAG: DeoR/GlpR family DNA-binding transcription regulator [Pirellulales bacterium]|nr:DeoR/GlpR transcriptional regulator [Planctomycetales bacterium]
MLAKQRRSELLELVRTRGFASLPELAEELSVSESTIRRDLDRLERSGTARRTHGGVFYAGGSPGLPHFEQRQPAHWPQKRSIARRAAELIEDGETVLLDGGSTTYEVARLLVSRPLQVVTNSLPVANLFASQTNIDLVLLGGYVYPRTGVSIGPYANDMLSSLNVQTTVLSVAGITGEGYYNSNLLLVETERAMIAAADRVMVVADSTKLGRRSLAHLCELGDVGTLVVDEQITPEWQKTIRAAGVELIVAGEPTTSDDRDGN